jgi:hypothetical protein
MFMEVPAPHDGFFPEPQRRLDNSAVRLFASFFVYSRVNRVAMAVTIIGIVRTAMSVKRFDTVWEKACRNGKESAP